MQFRDLKKQYQVLKQDIDAAMVDVAASSAFIMGKPVKELETELAEYVGVKHCISCGNGTDALTLALKVWNIGAGDAVFVPDFTFFSSAEVISLEGATPVFVDVDRETFNMDASDLERKIARTIEEGRLTPKVIITVDLFGLPANYPAIRKIADAHRLFILEDGAQGFGGMIGNKRACSFGDISTTSFFPAKPLGCYGDGGAVFTDDDGLAARIRALGSHGWFPKYDSRLVGMNSRLDTLQAAVLRVKLPHLDTWIAARRSVAARYTERLGGLTPVVTPVETPYATHVYHQYTVKVPPACRDGLRAALAKEGIPSMVYYPGTLYEQPAYRDACICDPAMRHAAALPAAVLSLPMDSELTDAEVERVTDAVCRYFADNESRYHE